MKEHFSEWMKAALIRAVKTMAQTAIGMIGMITVGAALDEVKWIYVLSVSATAGILSILTSIAGLPEVELQAKMESMKEQDHE